MKAAYKAFIGLGFILILTGCIAEDYDFTPPTVSIVNTYDITDEVELEAANINWDSDKKYTKDTKDIVSFAKEQKLLSYEPEEKMDITFNNQDFSVQELNVYAIKNGKEFELPSDDLTFILPNETGEYVLKVELVTEDWGSAEYVGNVTIKETNHKHKGVNGRLPDFTEMDAPYVINKGEKPLSDEEIGSIYEEVCWNNCDDDSKYDYQEAPLSDLEVGDDLQIDWHKLNPQPSEINLLQINTEESEVVKGKSINVNSPLKIEVDDTNIGAQYALEFLWKEEKQVVGRSILNFKLK